MKIRHYITFNNGGGPVTLVSFDDDGPETMIRIVHEARFGGVSNVDAAAARAAVAGADDLGEATTTVPRELRQRITGETLAAVAAQGHREQALRWNDQGEGILFADADAAQAWDQANEVTGEQATLMRTRRRVMMG